MSRPYPWRLSRWPVWRQLSQKKDGTGSEAFSPRTLALRARIEGAETARSVCPFCAVGCGQLIHHRNGELLSIEGDPESPINEGKLCPKGAASRELLTHDGRLDKVHYRAPYQSEWTTLDLDDAMDRVADRVWESCARTSVPEESADDERPLRQTRGVAHLGGATLDNEENYLIKKLLTGGLGIVRVSNQARI